MDDKRLAPRVGDCLDEAVKACPAILFVDPQPAFHCYRHGASGCGYHSRYAGSNEIRLRHQARAKTASLNAVRGAPAVQVDFVIPVAEPNMGSARQLFRVASAELEGNRGFGPMMVQKALTVAEDDCGRRDHFCVKARMLAQLTVKIPTMPVGPLHHGRDTESVCLINQHLCSSNGVKAENHIGGEALFSSTFSGPNKVSYLAAHAVALTLPQKGV